MLVERSIYSKLPDEPTSTDPEPEVTTTQKKKSARKVRPKKAKGPKGHAQAHGLGRGGSNEDDELPDGLQPSLDPEADDEGLRIFIQSTTC